MENFYSKWYGIFLLQVHIPVFVMTFFSGAKQMAIDYLATKVNHLNTGCGNARPIIIVNNPM